MKEPVLQHLLIDDLLQWSVVRTDGYWVWGSDMEFRGDAGIGAGVVAVYGWHALEFLG